MDSAALAEELLAAVGTLRRQVRRTSGRPWPASTLTGAQLDLLRVVRARPGLAVAEAADALGVAANTVSTLVGQLAAAGLLSREADSADRRIARLTLTPSAQHRVAVWRDRRAAVVGGAVAQLPPVDARALAAALPALQQLCERMRVVADAGPTS